MTDWSEVEAMATKQDNDNWYGRADLINLVPGTDYRVKVASKNTEGYNKFSRAHTFATPSIGNVYFVFKNFINIFFFRSSQTESNFFKSILNNISDFVYLVVNINGMFQLQ